MSKIERIFCSATPVVLALNYERNSTSIIQTVLEGAHSRVFFGLSVHFHFHLVAVACMKHETTTETIERRKGRANRLAK